MNCLNFADLGLPVIVGLIMPIIAPRYQPPSGYYKQESKTTHLGQAMEVMEINHTEQAKKTGLMWKGEGASEHGIEKQQQSPARLKNVLGISEGPKLSAEDKASVLGDPKTRVQDGLVLPETSHVREIPDSKDTWVGKARSKKERCSTYPERVRKVIWRTTSTRPVQLGNDYVVVHSEQAFHDSLAGCRQTAFSDESCEHPIRLLRG